MQGRKNAQTVFICSISSEKVNFRVFLILSISYFTIRFICVFSWNIFARASVGIVLIVGALSILSIVLSISLTIGMQSMLIYPAQLFQNQINRKSKSNLKFFKMNHRLITSSVKITTFIQNYVILLKMVSVTFLVLVLL